MQRQSPLQSFSKALISALLITFIGTAIHQSTWNGAPVGLGFSFLLLLAAALELRKTKSGSWFFTIFVSAGLFISAMATNQDAMLPANDQGFIWSYGAIGLSAIVSLWPRLKKGSKAKP